MLGFESESTNYQVLDEQKDTLTGHPERKCIHELFEAQVAQNPNAVAVLFDNERLTYAELNTKANQLAHYLVKQGVKPDSLVGLCVERSMEIVIGLLGILKAGGAYVPIDPSHPQSRMEYVLKDSGVDIVLTQRDLLSVLPLDGQQTLLLDSDVREPLLGTYSTKNINTQDLDLCSSHLAYVIYTSGSTGQPKGVMLEHNGVCNLAVWQARYFDLSQGSHISQFASYTFDGSVGETFMALLNGATLVMLERDQSPASLMKSINDNAINVIVLVPSLLKELDPTQISNPDQLTVVAVGETCPVELTRTWSSYCNFQNGYGPTECTVYSHIWGVSENLSKQLQLRVPIGKSIDNISSYILDKDLNPVAPGEIGEIFLTGPGLARGYLNRADLTAEKFIPNPFYDAPFYADRGVITEDGPITLLSDLNEELDAVSPPKELQISDTLPATDLIHFVEDELDADLLDKTKDIVDKYGNRHASYECLQRYILEGINNNYASGGIGQKVLSTLLPFDDYSRAQGVDFGFGNAEILRVLNHMGASVTGLDICPVFVEKARNIGLNVRMSKIDVEPEEFEQESGIFKESQDFVISTLTLDRVEKPLNLLLNMFSVLKTGGTFALQTLLPVVAVEDGEVEDPVVFTQEEDRITPGENADEDKTLLINILNQLGASDIYVYHIPYTVKSRDGVQEYKVWSLCGRKQSKHDYIMHEQRLYRTGDLGLYREDGNIEFVGRVDDQVKIRGFRLELGEISARLTEHPSVKDATISVWEPQPEDKRLVAHVVADESYTLPDTDIVAQQQEVFDVNYASQEANPSADFTGWNDSYAGAAIPQDEMVAWRDETVNRIINLKPKNILEIGFGTGLMLFGVVPHCRHYVGTDLSPTVYHNVLKNLPLLGNDAAKVKLLNGGAHELSTLTEESFDTIISNSVVQYFPNFDYFLSVIEQSKQRLSNDGKIFLGDVRCYGQLLTMLHTSIELFKSYDDDQNIKEVRQTAKYKANNDTELVLSRELFLALKEQSDGLTHVQIIPNLDDNELKYRYSVILHFGDVSIVENIAFTPWQAEQHSLEQIEAHLLETQPAVFALSGIAHTGLYSDWQALTVDSDNIHSVGELKRYLAELEALGLHPRQLEGLAARLGYYCELSWLNCDETGAFDVVLTRNDGNTSAPPINVFPASNLVLKAPLETYANNPQLRDMRRTLTPLLRDALSAKLPAFMLPSYFMFYDALPLTSVGKIDNKALLVPDMSALLAQDYVAPETKVEMLLATVWADVLGFDVEQLGRHANFYTLGGDSITSLQIIARARKLGIYFTPKHIFEHKTIAKLAEVVEREGSVQADPSQVSGESSLASIQHGLSSSKTGIPLERLDALIDELEISSQNQIEAVYPLTPLQQGMLYHYRLDPPHGAYIEQLMMDFSGELDLNAFKQAWIKLIQRHGLFRTTFVGLDTEKPLQVVIDQVDLPWFEEDWSKMSPESQELKLQEYLADDRHQGYDLKQAPLMRLILIRLADDHYKFIWSVHHATVDGWSVANVYDELFVYYSGACLGTPVSLPPVCPYQDYIAWLTNKDTSQYEHYWRNYLKGFTVPTPIPNDRRKNPNIEIPNDRRKSSNTEQGFTPEFNEKALPDTLTATLNTLTKEKQLTLNTVMQGVWAILLSRYSGAQDIVFGITVSGRPPELDDMERMVGPLINTIPLRTQVEPDAEVLQWLDRLNHQCLVERTPFEHAPLYDIQRWSEIDGGTALFKSIFVVENYPSEKSIDELVSDTKLHIGQFDYRGWSDYPLAVLITVGEKTKIRIEYDPRIFDLAIIEDLVNHYQIILEGIIKHPQSRLSHLKMLTDKERAFLIEQGKGAEIEYSQGLCVHNLFESQVAKQKDAIAVSNESGQLSYAELEQRSNRLANFLISKGVRPESRVGLCLDRSLDMIVAILGILKSGAAYVPMDPRHPFQRLVYVVVDSGVEVVLTESEYSGRLRQIITNQTLVSLDTSWPLIEAFESSKPDVTVSGNNIAYLIYTSGSTGRPKGVMVTHASCVNHMMWMQQTFDFDSNDKILQKTPLSFDASVWEWCLPLQIGAQLVLAKAGGQQEPDYLLTLIEEQNITVLQVVPTLLGLLLDSPNSKKLVSLKYLFSGGEPLTVQLCNRFHRLMLPTRLCNLYGPTEATIDTTYWLFDPAHSQSVPIGHPIANVQLYILDPYTLDPVPDGVAGELFIGGSGLARGYLNKPELTAEKFIPNTFGGLGERLYRSGDMVYRSRKDGLIYYVERIDSQVKISGYRIELGEIENQLRDHPAVHDGVVTVREDEPGNKRLVAYMVPDRNYTLEDKAAAELVSHSVEQWQSIHDSNYDTERDVENPFDDFIGWNSSYTDMPIPIEEMKEWAETTVERILALKPKRVLEIGCGTGLLLGRVVPHCEHYVGTDFAPHVIEQLRSRLPELGSDADKVSLLVGRADEVSELRELQGQQFDCIIMNSVVQYFPNIEYLGDVLTKCLQLLTEDGHIFVGDIRHLGLLDTFHASVQLHRATDDFMPFADFKNVVKNRAANDKELVISPGFFQAFRVHHPTVTHIQVFPKLGEYCNELSKFRYEVVLHTAKHVPLASNISWEPWHTNKMDSEEVQSYLFFTQPNVFALSNVPNTNLISNLQILEEYAGYDDSIRTIGDLKTKLVGGESIGITPYELIQIGEQAGYFVEISWAHSTSNGQFHVVFHKQQARKQTCPISVFPYGKGAGETLSYRDHANNPQRQEMQRILVPILREYLGQRLPEYMVPSFLVILDKLPLNTSGKIDRKALPAPEIDTLQIREYVAPSSEIERKMAAIWEEVLNIPEGKVGVLHDFFEMGGHSISVMRVIAQCKQIGFNLTVKDVFNLKTIHELAACLSETTQSEEHSFNLQDEIKLDDSIKIEGLPKADIENPQAILLTGTTGFVGAFLLQELLDQTGAQIYCLVRAESVKKGLERIKQQLEQYQLYDEENFRRVVPIIGDLSRPMLGLDQVEFESLAANVDMIFHNGAWVNHVYSYDLLRDANVGGTHEILKLATHKKLKAVHHISIATAELIQDEDFEENIKTPDYGYVLTKYVAEKLAHAAIDRGVPVCVYRLPMISGDTHSGVWNKSNRVRMLIEGCIKLGYAPDAEGLFKLCGQTLTPVDFIKKFVIKVAQQPDCIGNTYNITNPQLVDWNELLVAMLNSGFAVATLPLGVWKARLSIVVKRDPDNKLYETLVGLFVREVKSLSDQDSVAGCSQYEVNNAILNELDRLGLDLPVVDREIFATYIGHIFGDDYDGKLGKKKLDCKLTAE